MVMPSKPFWGESGAILKMYASRTCSEYVTITSDLLGNAEGATEYTRHPGRVTRESISRMIKAEPRLIR
jgi:hypothetical protein